MKTEIKEQDPSQLLSVKKSSHGRRGKRKARSALPEGSEASGAANPSDVTSQPPGGVTSQPPGGMASQSDDVTSEPDGVTSDANACQECGIQTKNSAQLAAHFNSKRHARRRRELRILDALSVTEAMEVTDVTEAADKATLAARLARGSARLEAPAPLKDADLPDCITKKCEGKIRQIVSYSCALCSVKLNSLVKVQEHLTSQRHTALVEGRPPPVRSDRHSARKAKTKAAVKQSWFW